MTRVEWTTSLDVRGRNEPIPQPFENKPRDSRFQHVEWALMSMQVVNISSPGDEYDPPRFCLRYYWTWAGEL